MQALRRAVKMHLRDKLTPNCDCGKRFFGVIPGSVVDRAAPDVGCVVTTSACVEGVDVFNGVLTCDVVAVDAMDNNGSAADASAISRK